MFLKNRNFISKINRSKVTDHAALNSISVTAMEVESVLESLTFTKTCGPYAINNRVLKEFDRMLLSPRDEFHLYGSKHQSKKKTTLQISLTTNQYLFEGPLAEYKIVHRYVFNFCRDHEILTTL